MKLAFVYVTDERGWGLVRYSALSLALSQRRRCDIHVFCHRFSLKDSDRLHGALAELGASLTLHRIADEALERHPTYGHVTKPALLKLAAMDRLTSAYDRIAYIDNDMLVFADMTIESLEFGSLPIAAVIDMDLTETGAIARSRRRPIEAASVPRYFNSGFMICESRNWLSGEFNARYAAALREHDRRCPYKANCTSVDQCAWNRAFEGRWLPLPVSYNMQATAKFTSYWKTASVRHYCGTRKFVPVSLFRNDGRDIAHLNRIRPRLGLPRAGIPLVHETLYLTNFVRNYLSGRELRRFLEVLHQKPAGSLQA